MIGKELDRCGNHLSRAGRNRNSDRLTATYNSQDREEFLQRDVFTPKNVTFAATKDKLYVSVDLFARWRIVDPLQYFLRLHDERSGCGVSGADPEGTQTG